MIGRAPLVQMFLTRGWTALANREELDFKITAGMLSILLTLQMFESYLDLFEAFDGRANAECSAEGSYIIWTGRRFYL